MPRRCNKGCLAKRKCQGGEAWLIRFYGRIIYEQSRRVLAQVKAGRRGSGGHCYRSSIFTIETKEWVKMADIGFFAIETEEWVKMFDIGFLP